MKLTQTEQNAAKGMFRFEKVARNIVNKHLVESSNAEKEAYIGLMSMDMAMGEVLTRNKYVGVGLVIGVAATVVARRIWDRVEERRLDKMANDWVAEQEAKEASEEQED